MNKRIDELLHSAKSVGVTKGDLRNFANDALETARMAERVERLDEVE